MLKHLHTLLTSLAIVTAGLATGCSGSKQPGTAVIDCLVADRAKIDALITDLGTKTKPDGSRDWSAIEADALVAGVEIGGCALAEFVESFLAPASGLKAPSDGVEARQTLEHFRSTKTGGASFKTRFGTL